MQPITLGDLAQRLDGHLFGPSDLVIHAAKTLRDAGPGEITFADRPRLSQQAEHSGASAVITSASFEPPRIPHIAVHDVVTAFTQVVELFSPPSEERIRGVSASAHVSRTARLGVGVRIGPGATVGEHVVIGDNTVIHAGCHVMAGCKIGQNVTIFPRVVLYEDTAIGDRVIIHAGAVIGAYGFGYATVDGQHQLSAQLGNVEIHNDVEIGANTTIDRGTYGATIIGEGTKVDNLVMIAHNCRIGRHNLLCSQVGIAGSAVTGDYVAMAGQVGVRDHVTIGNTVQVGAQAGVAGDIAPGLQVLGTPAKPERESIQELMSLTRLPKMRKRLREMERQMQAMEAAINALSQDGLTGEGADESAA